MQSETPFTEVPADEAKRPRGRPRKSDITRDEGNRRPALLQAAAVLFRQKGYAATTTRDIAAAAGMQSGSPFYHFKSKETLLFAVMEQGMLSAQKRQIAAQIQMQSAVAPAQERLRVLIQVHLEVLHGPGNDFVPVMLFESRSLQAKQRKHLAQLIANYEGLWMPVLEQLYAAGQLQTPVGLARLLIFGALNWSVQWFDSRKSASLNDLTNAAMLMFIKEK
jgi:TetR/AcrR family transcriptional regulator, cholesterol catabolism regulator